MKASSCPNLVKFSIAVATECSDSSPCTNRPIVCPHCDDSESSPVVWSYNFRSHLLRKHTRISLEDHTDILVLTKLEKEGMRRVWEHRLKQRKAHWKSQRAPLVISEAHRSCLVLKYVFLFYFIHDSLLMRKIYSSEVVLGLDASDKGSDCSSDHDDSEEVVELDDDEDDTTPMPVVTEDNGQEIQDLESGCE